jgi:hypothetical protein
VCLAQIEQGHTQTQIFVELEATLKAERGVIESLKMELVEVKSSLAESSAARAEILDKEKNNGDEVIVDGDSAAYRGQDKDQEIKELKQHIQQQKKCMAIIRNAHSTAVGTCVCIVCIVQHNLMFCC